MFKETLFCLVEKVNVYINLYNLLLITSIVYIYVYENKKY